MEYAKIEYKEWIKATVIGEAVALVTLMLAFFTQTQSPLITFLSWCCSGACIGYFQYNVLRKKTTIGKEWIIYNVLGAALSSLILDVLPMQMFDWATDIVPDKLSYIILGIIMSAGINGYSMNIITYGIHGLILGSLTGRILRKNGLGTVRRYVLFNVLGYTTGGVIATFADSLLFGYPVPFIIFNTIVQGICVGSATAYGLRSNVKTTAEHKVKI